jgi:acetyl-CoA C-acetyltransferase
LKPAFDKSDKGTLTAGNSTIFTDGAAAALLGSEEFARQNNLSVQAYLTDAQGAAVEILISMKFMRLLPDRFYAR